MVLISNAWIGHTNDIPFNRFVCLRSLIKTRTLDISEFIYHILHFSSIYENIYRTIRPMPHKIKLGFQDRSYLNPVFFRGIIKMYCLFAKLFVIAKEIRKPLTN